MVAHLGRVYIPDGMIREPVPEIVMPMRIKITPPMIQKSIVFFQDTFFHDREIRERSKRVFIQKGLLAHSRTYFYTSCLKNRNFLDVIFRLLDG